MVYSEKFKLEIIKRLQEETVTQISNGTGIPKRTLYNWKSKYKEIEQINDNIKQLMKERQFEEAEKIARKYMGSEKIVVKLIIILTKRRKFEEAEKIALNYPNSEKIQAQLMRVYRIEGKNKEFQEILEKFPESEYVQYQLILKYFDDDNYKEVMKIADRFPKGEYIQTQLVLMYIKVGDYEEARRIAKQFPEDEFMKKKIQEIEGEVVFQPFLEKRCNKFYLKIRDKIKEGKIDVSDSEELEELMNELAIKRKKYYLIKIAICVNLNQKGNALEIIEQIEGSYKVDENFKCKLKSKEAKFDMDDWDNLIGWNLSEIEKVRRENEENDKVEEKKNENDETSTTIFESMNEKLKDAIDSIKCKYHNKMQLTDIKEVEEEYLKRSNKLQSILNCVNTNKRAQMELILILINEGYEEVVEDSFPQEDYNFISTLIKQYEEKKLEMEGIKGKLDEYCL